MQNLVSISVSTCHMLEKSPLAPFPRMKLTRKKYLSDMYTNTSDWSSSVLVPSCNRIEKLSTNETKFSWKAHKTTQVLMPARAESKQYHPPYYPNLTSGIRSRKIATDLCSFCVSLTLFIPSAPYWQKSKISL